MFTFNYARLGKLYAFTLNLNRFNFINLNRNSKYRLFTSITNKKIFFEKIRKFKFSELCFNVRSKNCLIKNYSSLEFSSNNENHDSNVTKKDDVNIQQYVNRPYQENYITKEIENNIPLSVEQWEEIRTETLKSGSILKESNIDGFIINTCIKCNSFYSGKSYLEYMMSSKKKLNLAFIGNYMKLCYIFRSKCKEEDIKILETLYTDHILHYPYLDAKSAESIVMGISITKFWRDYIKYFDMINLSCSPGLRAYSVVINTAFYKKEYELALQLLDEMAIVGKTPLQDVFECWLEIIRKEKKFSYLELFFKYLGDYDIKPTLDIAIKIKNVYDDLKQSKLKTAFTSISNDGICRTCKKTLKAVIVTDEEFYQLKNAFLDPILIGKDIFLKTRPDEILQYQKLLKETAPYDIVLDGLNIAYAGGSKNKSAIAHSFMVKSVVEHFVKQSKKVLVLGRKHMNRWPQSNMKYIKDNASIFFADDLSQDDPFLLYATLYSGPKTNFVSRDLMRGHQFLLKDLNLKSIFIRWQVYHQYFLIYVGKDGKVTCKPPLMYRQSAQKSLCGCWHIPYKDEEKNLNIGQRTFKTTLSKSGWLCLS
uniref:Mitochondrial ribonuclease P catalytic subunit n=1 Tax=Clastoptera arizonana TaxID=38151 RepID=A0A1B6EBK8_9HEMI